MREDLQHESTGLFQHVGFPPSAPMGFPQHGLHHDAQALKRHGHPPHLLDQGGLPPGVVGPPGLAPPPQLPHSSSLSPSLYSPSSLVTADMSTSMPMDVVSYAGADHLHGLQPAPSAFSGTQGQPGQQLPAHDPLSFTNQNLPKSLSVGPTPGTLAAQPARSRTMQESSPTPGILSTQASGVTKPRPTEGLFTDPQRSSGGDSDQRGLVRAEPASATSDPLQPAQSEVVQKLELEELKKLIKKTEKDIQVLNMKAARRVERGNSSDSLLSLDSERSHVQTGRPPPLDAAPPAQSTAPPTGDAVPEEDGLVRRARRLLYGDGQASSDLPDELVDAIVKTPTLNAQKR